MASRSRVFENAVFRMAGDRGLLAEFGEGIDPDINQKVRAMAQALDREKPCGVNEIIPTYRSLLFIYDPLKTDPEQLSTLVRRLEGSLEQVRNQTFKVVEIPVCYGGEYGPDMENVTKAHGLSEDEVIRLHTAPEYLIYMVGFTPGFAFLGGLDERLYTPRLETPRMKVPKGSVGIANDQTGMYPIASPGGWQLIGRTPLDLFVPDRADPFLYRAGDKIRFTSITESEFRELATKGDLR